MIKEEEYCYLFEIIDKYISVFMFVMHFVSMATNPSIYSFIQDIHTIILNTKLALQVYP
jgi:hypothetical protein